MKYIEENLLRDEKIIYAIRPHWIVYGRAVVTLVFCLFFLIGSPTILSFQILTNYSGNEILTLILLVMTIYFTVQAYIYRHTSEFGITNKRVLAKIGWIQRTSLEIMLSKVEGVFVDQSIIGRIFNFGVISIIGTGGTRDAIPFIPDPLQFRKQVQQQIDLLSQQHTN